MAAPSPTSSPPLMAVNAKRSRMSAGSSSLDDFHRVSTGSCSSDDYRYTDLEESEFIDLTTPLGTVFNPFLI